MRVIKVMKRKLSYLRNTITFRTQLFGMDLSRLMGPDGTRGLPRVIIDAIAYLRSEGLPQENVVNRRSGS